MFAAWIGCPVTHSPLHAQVREYTLHQHVLPRRGSAGSTRLLRVNSPPSRQLSARAISCKSWLERSRCRCWAHGRDQDVECGYRDCCGYGGALGCLLVWMDEPQLTVRIPLTVRTHDNRRDSSAISSPCVSCTSNPTTAITNDSLCIVLSAKRATLPVKKSAFFWPRWVHDGLSHQWIEMYANVLVTGSDVDSGPIRVSCNVCIVLLATYWINALCHSGTVNYLHLFPQFCISIALVIKCVRRMRYTRAWTDYIWSSNSKQPVVGAIYAPFTPGISSHPQDSQNGTLYSAAHGLGSFLTQVNPENFSSLLTPPTRQDISTCSPTQYSARLPLLKPAGVFPPEAPKSCLFAAEWGKDRRDKLDGNLTKKVNSMWNMACEIGGRQGKGGEFRFNQRPGDLSRTC